MTRLATVSDAAEIVRIANGYFALHAEFADEAPWTDRSVAKLLADSIVTLDTDALTVWRIEGRLARGMLMATLGSNRQALQRLGDAIKLGLQSCVGCVDAYAIYTLQPLRNPDRMANYFQSVWGVTVETEVQEDGTTRFYIPPISIAALLARRGW